MMVPPSARQLAGNLFSSYAYLGLMALVTLFVLPVYVRTLGPAQWGSVALCITLQGFLLAMDVALGPLMLRDVARAAAAGRLRNVYRRFLKIHASLALPIFVAGQIALLVFERYPAPFGDPIASDLAWALRLALVQFLFQFSNNAAIGFWNGQQRQGFANGRLACFAFAKHGIALLLVTQWAAGAVAYMAPFAIVGAIEFMLNFATVRRELPVPTGSAPIAEDTTDWHGVAAFGVAVAFGMMTAQIDRVFLALSLAPQQFGVYFLVCSLMLSLLHLQAPIQRAFLPRIATADSPYRAALTMMKVSIALLSLPCLALAAVPELVLQLWLHDPAITAQGALPLRLLLVAAAINAAVGPSNALLLNQHRYRFMAVLNAAILGVQCATLVALTPVFGMTAGALSWLACAAIQLICAAVVWRAASATASPRRA